MNFYKGNGIWETWIKNTFFTPPPSSFGKELWLNLAFMSFTSGGEPHLLVMFEDDTERQRAAAALQAAHDELEQRVHERTIQLQSANQALEKASRAKDEFMATMSHELRTPLTGILGLADSLLYTLSDGLSDKQLKIVQNIQKNGQRLQGMVKDVLDFTQIQSGKIDLRTATCSVAKICQASLQAVKSLAEEKQQNLLLSLPPEDPTVRVDERKIQQALLNLLDNAIKFTPRQGRIELSATADPAHEQVRISVCDTGIGIREEDLARLFQPFVQLDASLARMYSGAGLGLALSKALVGLHGGSIEVKSTFGQGSCFTVILPWHPQEAAQL